MRLIRRIKPCVIKVNLSLKIDRFIQARVRISSKCDASGFSGNVVAKSDCSEYDALFFFAASVLALLPTGSSGLAVHNGRPAEDCPGGLSFYSS